MAVDSNRVADVLKTLSPLQEKVVRLFFGFGCERSHSAAEIAREFHVSPQTISGILSWAQRRLRQAGVTATELRQVASLPIQAGRKHRPRCRHNFRFLAAAQ